MEKTAEASNSAVVVKAGFWYTICNFLFKGMAFLTTPIFTRIMTKSENGDFGNYSSWMAIMLVLTSFDLAQSVIRSKLEHEKDMDCYVWSVLSFSTIATAIWFGFALIFPSFFCKLFDTEPKYLYLMFAYFFTVPAYQMLITKHRAFYKYKLFVLLTGISLVSGTVLSVLLTFLMNNKLDGRIFGFYIPQILLGAGIYIYCVIKGGRIKTEYWKYACVICLPLVPHVLSLFLLSASDKVLLKKMCGSEYTGIYIVAYAAYHIVTILFDSMNKAWAPWLLESLHKKNYDSIKKVSRIYILVFVILAAGLLLVVPEVIAVLGGKGYEGAVYCLPPLVISAVIQLIYTMYVNIEFYKKKTVGAAGATIVASLLNIILNLLLIPLNVEYSFVIAAYTTLAGYAALFVLHYFLVRRMKMDFVYDIRYILVVIAAVSGFSLIMNFVYKHTALRVIMLAVYAVLFCTALWKNKDRILTLLRSKTGKGEIKAAEEAV